MTAYISLYNEIEITADNSITNQVVIHDAMTLGFCTQGVLHTDNAGVVSSSSVIESDIKDDAITENKIADDSVSNNKIQNNAITTAKILDSNVTDAKISSLSASKLTGTVTIPVSNASVTTSSATVNGNIAVTGTVDGVDVSAFKTDYDSKVNQDVRPSASPTFANLITSGLVDGRDVSTDGATLDNLNTTLGLGGLTTTEVNQLKNINSSVFSSAQWTRLAGINQDLATSSVSQFDRLALGGTYSSSVVAARLQLRGTNSSIGGPHLACFTSISTYPLFYLQPNTPNNISLMFDSYWDGTDDRTSVASASGIAIRIRKTTTTLNIEGGSNLSAGGIVSFVPYMTVSSTDLATIGTVNGVNIATFKTDYDSKVNQDVRTTASPTFANLITSGLVDGVDVSSFKSDYDSKVNQDVRSTASPTFVSPTCTTLITTPKVQNIGGDIKMNTDALLQGWTFLSTGDFHSIDRNRFLYCNNLRSLGAVPDYISMSINSGLNVITVNTSGISANTNGVTRMTISNTQVQCAVNVDVTGNITVSGTVDGRDVSTDGAILDNLNTTIGLGGLTAAEVNQLKNIDSSTFSSAQWTRLSNIDQDLVTTSTPYFAKLGVGGANSSSPASKLAITGTNNSTAGPHMTFYTNADAYPLMQIYPLTHDSITLAFDTYNLSGAFYSSGNVGSWTISKSGGHLITSFGSAVAGFPVTLTPVTRLNDNGQLLVTDGSNSFPPISFMNDTDTGLYHIGSNNMGVACNGAKVLDIATSGLGVTGDITVSGNVDGVDVSAFKTDYDSKVNQNVKTTASPTFAGQTINGNITVSGNVDGVDVSTFKSDYDAKINQDVRTSASPSFTNLTLSGINASTFYATGTWSVTVGDSLSRNFTLTTNVGSYTRIGNMYNCLIQVAWSSKGSASGTIRYSLPTTLTSNWPRCPGVVGYMNGVTWTNMVLCSGDSGTNFVRLLDASKTGSSPTDLTNTSYSASGEVQLTLTFLV